MAVKREIRTTLALDGENEYKKALGEAQRGLRVLGSELKLASAEFETNGDQQAFLTAKSRTLRSEIAQQEEIVKSLERRGEGRGREIRRDGQSNRRLPNPAQRRQGGAGKDAP